MRMTHAAIRRPANLSLDSSLMEQARRLDINLSRAAESGIAEAVRIEQARRWRVENAPALESSNAYVERSGLPLQRFRQF